MLPAGLRLRRFILLLALCLTAVLAWPAWSTYQQVRFSRHVAFARAALDRQDLAAAATWIQRVAATRPQSSEMAFLEADLEEGRKSPESVKWRELAARRDPKNMDAFLRWARTALAFGDSAAALDALGHVVPETTRSAAWHTLQAAACNNLGDLAQGEANLIEAIRLDPHDLQSQVNLEALRLCSTAEQVAAQARRRLSILSGHPEVQNAAQRVLLADALRHGDRLRVADLSRLLLGPNSSWEDRLLGLEADMQTDPTAISYERFHSLAGQDPFRAGELAQLLACHGRSADAWKWLDRLSAWGDLPVGTQIIGADLLTNDGRWPELRSFLQNLDWKGWDYVRRAMLVRAGRELHDPAAAGDWRQLVLSLRSDSDQTLNLVETVAHWGWREEADALRWELVDLDVPVAGEIVNKLQREAIASRDSEALYRCVRWKKDQHPENPAYQCDFAYLSLLVRPEDRLALEAAETAWRAKPHARQALAVVG
ncbi:MAG TPA: hypothetical protein VGD78_03370, partial [Chthoniobacterales bacterium]